MKRTHLTILFAIVVFSCFSQNIQDQSKASVVFSKSSQTLGNTRSQGLDIADVDMDNDLDILFSNYIGTCPLWLNNGDGTFTKSNQLFNAQEPHDVALADFDGDSFPDVLIISHVSPVKLYINNGSGNFTENIQNLGSAAGYPQFIDVADIDSDGDKDFLIYYYEAENRIWINDGAANFTMLNIDIGGDNAKGFEFADFNGDNIPDLFINMRGLPNKVFMNDGTGNFIDEGCRVGIGGDATDCIDFDNDGDNDLIISNGVTGTTVWLNQNNGESFLAGSNFSEGAIRCKVFDANIDGAYDIITANLELGNKLWLNNGSGSFEDHGQIFGDHEVFSLGYGDWDNDGDLDVVTGQMEGTGGNSIYFNESSINTSYEYLGQTPPGLIPERFPPDSLLGNSEWWWIGSPIFSPNGLEMISSRHCVGVFKNPALYLMEVENQNWSTPYIPDFCSNTSGASPSYTFSGDTLFFTSYHPEIAIFFVVRDGNNWSDPVKLIIPKPANAFFIGSISVAKSGSIYYELFSSNDVDLYKSDYVDGEYSEPINLGAAINSPAREFGVFVDPYEQYIIYSSLRSGGYGNGDLYLSIKNSNDEWMNARNLGSTINSAEDDFGPYISRDNKYFFFCTSKENDIGYNPYWVDASMLDISFVSIQENQNEEALQAKQIRNYPNPFAHNTTIEFDLNAPAVTSLNIYNINGQLTENLIDNELLNGNQKINWNTDKNINSGVYYYQLITNSVSETRKMIIQK
jgi:FG-GAP-like repeat/Secretion system C-terminal sorting domain